MIHFALLFSRQGKVRLSKYYVPYSQKERGKLVKEVTGSILQRHAKLCNVVEHRGLKLVYKRYASLYFALAVDDGENELIVLEMIQHYVEILDRYFGSVCELDLIYNFHKGAAGQGAPKSGGHCFTTNAGDRSDRLRATVQTDYPDCCPYIVQYTPNTRLTLSFIHRISVFHFGRSFSRW